MKLLTCALVLAVYTASEAMSGAPVPASGAVAATSVQYFGQQFGLPDEPADSPCGASHMRYLLGQQVHEVDLPSLSQYVRVAYPNAPQHNGENPARLNLDVTHSGVILDASCG